MRACLLAVPCLALLASDTRADLLQSGQIMRVTFTIDNNWTTLAPDALLLDLGIIQVNAAFGSRIAALFDGATLLGTDVNTSFANFVGSLILLPSNAFVAPSSVWALNDPEIVDFTSILDGSITGVIDFSIAQGEVDIPLGQVDLKLLRGTGSSSGMVINPAPTITSVQILDGPAGTNSCISVANSTGNAGTIGASGSQGVSANNLVLEADGLPALQNGVFFYGPVQAQVPFGNGFLCVGTGATGIARLAIEQSDALGFMQHALDLTAPPTSPTTITFGSTWFFQGWYRDPAAGGAAFNLTDGLEVTFGA